LTPDPDPRWFLQINGFARDTPWLHSIITAYADYRIAVFAALLVAGWWIARRQGDLTVLGAAVWAPMGALAAVAINQPIVALVAEPRPYAVLPHSLVLAQRSSDPSFPSDHAVLAGAVVAGLWRVSGRLWAVAVLAAAVIAFARVYIGAHYPHDVFVGVFLGSGLSTIGFWATRPILLRLLQHAEDSRLLRPLLVAADTVGPSNR
jgi:membrane-associated phospholipid phosphatase